jgi:hypothetical protein
MDATEFQDLYEYLDSDNKVYPSWLVGNENKGKRQQFSRKASKYSIRQSARRVFGHLEPGRTLRTGSDK